MIYEDIQVSGSISISGSFTIPVHATTTAANQSTGSLFFDSTAKLFKVFQSGAGALNVASQPFTPPAPVAKGDIEYLVIGGGGSGGQLGGGGAGGHLSSSFAQVSSGSSLTVTVGGGGASITSVVRGNTGTDSSIAVTGYTTATALGGGGGGGQGAASDAGTGKDGGSGGGGGENDSGTNTPGSGTSGQGNDGGTGGTGAGTQLSGGGGGGAGAAGSNAAGQSSGGAGGNGLANKITGTSTTRAGGGGGGAWWYNNGGSSYGGAGGSGGGGAAGTTGNTAAVSGTANTGGGGGGAGFTSAGWWITDSGTGGSGVAILRYPSSSIGAFGGTELKSNSGERIHKFTTSGTLVVGNNTTTPPLDNHYPSTVTKPNIFINPRAIGVDGTFDTIPDYGSVGRDFHNAGGSNNTKINTAAGSYDALDNAYGTGARGFVAGGTTLGTTYSEYNTNQDHSYNMFFRYDPSMESDLNYPLLWMVKPNTADNSTSYYGGIQIAVWRGGYSEVGKLYAGLYAVSNGSNVHGTTQTTTRTYGDTWYMATVVVTYGSSGNIKIYLNGSLETTSSTADNTSTGGSSNHVSIAESYWSTASVNPGGMTIGVSHAWFGTALTATDVTNLWNFYKADYGLS